VSQHTHKKVCPTYRHPNLYTHGVTSRAGTGIRLEYLRSHTFVSGIHVAQSLAFSAVFCRSVFVHFLLAIVRKVWRYQRV